VSSPTESEQDQNSEPASPSRKSWKPKVAALGCSMFVSLFIAELAVRAIHGAPLHERMPLSRVQANLFRGWEMVPGESHYTYDHLVQINALGLRGEELPEARDPEELRILALGDSMIYGQGVSDGATLPWHLQEAMNAASEQTCRVINGGHRAYSTNQEVGLLRELGPEIDPDIVILFWFENDYDEYNIESRCKELQASGPRTFDLGTQASGKALLAWQAKQLARRSAIVMQVHDYMMSNPKGRPGAKWEEAGLIRLKGNLAEFSELCSTNGWQAVFAVIPHASALVPGGESSWQSQRGEQAKAAAQELGLTIVELEEPLRELTRESGRVPILPYDGHYVGAANRRMAEWLVQFLK
jgi:hypothetical protein